MNIEQAKTEIKRTAEIYLMKDAFGNYRMDRQSQRPIFMIGAPGIGKTAAVAQVAEEMHLPLVSYTMTHHTRQSAIGLPFIKHRTYQGEEFDVSVYTLSEIIASVYEAMESSGQKEGILFLDEINCVSETLAPAMLQFLQYKTFGNHNLPDGWIIVTAGNPQVFNRNARSFDIATLDRLKVLNVEPDYNAWKKYAQGMHVHPSILSFLDIHPDFIFHVESTVDGKIYVTPRGWEDLSKAMLLYEEKQFPIDETLIHQYLHDDRIVNAFASYLTLYGKYQENYPIAAILNGNVSDETAEKMKKAGWDEKISVTNLMLASICTSIQKEQIIENGLRKLRDPLRALKEAPSLSIAMEKTVDAMDKEYHQKNRSGATDRNEKAATQYAISFIRKNISIDAYTSLQKSYGEEVQKMKEMSDEISTHLHFLFAFLENNGDEQEMLLAITRLTTDENAAAFIANHGCKEYYQHSESLNMEKRDSSLRQEINAYRNR